MGFARTQGGHVTGLYLESLSINGGCHWRVMLEAGGKLRVGEQLDLDKQSHLRLIEKLDGGCWLAQLTADDDTLEVLERVGTTPLPPYILRRRRALEQRNVEPQDSDRYNTVYADVPGSVAAPTAGLHFTSALIDQLDQLGLKRASVTLNIGLGTFAPVRARAPRRPRDPQRADSYPRRRRSRLWGKRRAQGKRIIPIGTTSVRALGEFARPAAGLAVIFRPRPGCSSGLKRSRSLTRTLTPRGNTQENLHR